MISLNGSSPEPQSGRIWRPRGRPKSLVRWGREMMIRYPKCLLLLRTDVQLKEEQVEIIRQKLNLDFQAEE